MIGMSDAKPSEWNESNEIGGEPVGLAKGGKDSISGIIVFCPTVSVEFLSDQKATG